jgi:hypothetical protein
VLNQSSTMSWRHMGEWRYSSTILDLGTRWTWVVSFTTWLLYPRGKSPSTHWIRGWAGLKTGMDAVDKRKISFLCWHSNPSCPAHSLSLYQLSYPFITNKELGKLRWCIDPATGLIPSRGKKFSLPQSLVLGPAAYYPLGSGKIFSLEVVPKLRTYEAIPPPPHTTSSI